MDRVEHSAHQGVYAHRFNARAIRRPRPTVMQMTVKQFAARNFGRITVYGDAAAFRFNLDGIAQ